MHDFLTIPLALAASLVEAAFGYPACIYRLIGHPVTWVGALIAWLDQRFNNPARSSAWRRVAGLFSLCLLLGVVSAISLAVSRICSLTPLGAVLLIAVASSLIAQRSLYSHVAAVAAALETQGLAAARAAVSLIVGRDTASLDHAGVARAAIESLAENFSDGIIAPTLWLALGGLPGGSLYKAANTADSMIGHRTPRFAAFGWAAARFDDLINLPASRLAAVLIAAAAATTGGSARARSSEVDPTSEVNRPVQQTDLERDSINLRLSRSRRAIQAIRRDASRHRSPNAGWPEAAMAGALGLRLAGPRYYGNQRVDDAFMGNGRLVATAADIRRALAVFRAGCVMAWALLLAASLIQQF